jgi:hypothetical protein
MSRVRQLHDPATGRAWSTQCDGDTVEIVSGSPGRARRAAKAMADQEAAVAYARKQEWARLKQGFVLASPAAAAGEPLMHRHLGGGFTGAMVAEDLAGQLLCNRYDNRSDGAGDADSRLLLVAEDGSLPQSVILPGGRLPWQARYIPGLRRLLVRLDHQVFSGTVPLGSLEALTAPNSRPASFLGCAGIRAAWYAEPDIVVADLADGTELFRKAVPAQLHGGHSLQMEGALSPDGTMLAYCSRAGEVTICDVADGRVRHTWTGDFAMVSKLAFTPDGRRLIAREQYGRWRWHCLDLADGTHHADWLAPWDSVRSDLAISPEGRRMAIAHGTEVRVLDLATMQCLLRFPVEHAVRCCALAWVGDKLGVLTDATCASLYQVDTPQA